MAPPCEQCWPGIEMENLDAWDVYQLSTTDAMGVTSQGILAIAEKAGLSDPIECLTKISILRSHLEKVKKG